MKKKFAGVVMFAILALFALRSTLGRQVSLPRFVTCQGHQASFLPQVFQAHKPSLAAVAVLGHGKATSASPRSL